MPETIFMIHGMWGGPWCWNNFKDSFQRSGYHCVPAILRFHDMDPREPPDPRLGTTSLLDYAEDLEREIHELGVQPIVMGHSMGGLLAQILASRGLAKALVLLTPASPSGIVAVRWSVLMSFRSVQFRWGFWKKPMRQTFNEAVYSMMHLLSPCEQKAAYDKFVYESGRAAWEIGYWFVDPRRASRIEQSKITSPVLVIAAAEDRITPAPVVRRVAEKYRTVSTYKKFPNHAHWLIGEPGWEEVADHVTGWLEHALAGRTK